MFTLSGKPDILDKSTELYNQKQLLVRISQGDETAFRELFYFYKPRLFTAALRMLGDSDLAKDIYQDTFLKVWLNRASLPEIENFPGWLFTVSRNLMYDAIKRSAKNQSQPLDFLKEDASTGNYDPGLVMENKELQRVLQEAVDGLPPRQKETYQLIRIEGWSRLQVAEKMNLSPESVKTNMQYALRSIRAYCVKNLDLPLIFLFTGIFF